MEVTGSNMFASDV